MPKLYAIAGAIPFFAAIFLNAFVDVGHKIMIQNTVFKVYDEGTQIVLTAIVNALILLPYILLFSPAGFASDKYPKARVMQVSVWGAVVLTLGITFCYYMGWFWPAFGMTFLLAIQSAFYGPAKLGYIKTLFGKERLAQANSIAQATAIVAILLATFAFSIVFEIGYPGEDASKNDIIQNLAPVGWVLVATAVIELIMLYRLPIIESKDESATFSKKDFLSGRMAVDNLKVLTRREVIFLSVIGLAMFWSIGQVILAAFPAFAKETLGETNTIKIQGVLAASGLGIAIGSWLAGRVSKNHIESGLIPVGAIGIAVGLLLTPQLTSITAHIFNYLFLGIMGGLFIVPLNALIQFHAGEHELGTVLAGNNFVQNVAMIIFLILTSVSAAVGFGSGLILSFMAVFAIVVGFYTVYKLPQSLVRVVLTYAMTRHYRVRVQGLRNIPSKGGVLLLGNHMSWIDWAIVQIACPRQVRFVMLAAIYNRWYLTWLFKLMGCVPIKQGASSRDSLATVAELLEAGQVVCLFPEGSISRTGHLGTFRQGFERACELVSDDKPVVILPFYLRGLWGSQWSRSSEYLKKRTKGGLKRDLIVAFGNALPKTTTADVLKRRVFDLSISSWQEYLNELPSLPNAWIETCKRNKQEIALADGPTNLSPRRLLAGTLPFAKRIRNMSPEQNIGVLLPTSAGAVIANMAILLSGKTVVNLNYTASKEAVDSAIEQADIKTVYTSKLFCKRLEQRGINVEANFAKVKLVYLEEVKETISKAELLGYLAITFLPTACLKGLFSYNKNPQSTAAILFSSGSEGMPKGVQLSHQNIMANLKQIADVLNTQENDVIMASLPLFHAFGLTVTQFLPMVEGIPMICHPDPTDALGIAKQVAKHQATVMFGTSTFLRLFVRNKKVHPLMLNSLRYVIAGAEKLRSDVREQFQLKFNHHIYEGYGATETTPVASVNLPDALDTNYWQIQKGGKLGSVGMALPGSSFKVVDPDTLEELSTGEAGMILIGGSQVMQGYLNNPEKTAEAIKIIDGNRWYVTGDKGRLDEDGYLTIVDRYSRFAKLGGEMVSLTQVEEWVGEHLNMDDVDLVAVNVPDAKKGEKVVLISDKTLDVKATKQAMLGAGCSPMLIPDEWFTVEEFPKLGSGKTDFSQAKKLALELTA